MARQSVINVDELHQTADRANIRVGLIGQGIQLSRTPKMHMDAGAACGLNYSYELIDTDLIPGEPEIQDLLDDAEARGLAGVNVTHPYKQAAIPFLDILSDAARAVDAVNTVVFRDGKRFGHNTDYWGFGEAFRRNMEGAPRDRVLLIGAGGAGGAVANALMDNNVRHLSVFDASAERARKLVSSLIARTDDSRASVVSDLNAELAGVDGIVNATPVGMASHPGTPVPVELLKSGQWVADIIYFPLETALLAAAADKGCRVMPGSGMAVFQAVRAFELFSGIKPDPERMKATFDAFTPPPAGNSGI